MSPMYTVISYIKRIYIQFQSMYINFVSVTYIYKVISLADYV